MEGSPDEDSRMEGLDWWMEGLDWWMEGLDWWMEGLDWWMEGFADQGLGIQNAPTIENPPRPRQTGDANGADGFHQGRAD
jgi:hypothetical protein